jgi:UDP-N-acetylmuramoyl-tripeptide--D-alanyl-D-alanine ligase
MKSFFRNTVAALLAACARSVVRKYKPTVVMVTGSVGKTSTKDAIATVLHHSFYIRASEKSYNSEFGVPLTILGMKNPWSNVAAWFGVFGEALALILLPNHYPKILVLEVGADSPGDLEKILKIVTPDVVVVTKLPDMPVHVEAYATPEAVREEEFAPAYALAPGSPLIVSADDENTKELAAPLSVHVTMYGESEGADVRILSNEPHIKDDLILGMEGVIEIEGKTHTMHVRGALGRPQLLAPAAAIAVGRVLGMSVKDTLAAIESYEPPAGRGRLIAGKNNSVILDDSYNASPSAVEEALGSLQTIHTAQKGKGRRIAVLGDMLELGRYSREEHERIGCLAAESADVLVVVGVRSRATAECAKKEGMKEVLVHAFDTSTEAAAFLKEEVQDKDILLIKGSQSIRMERITAVLLRSTTDEKLLVRQDKEWKKR